MAPIGTVHAITGFVVKAPNVDLTSHGHPRVRVRIGQHQVASNRRTTSSYHDLIAYRDTADVATLLMPGDDIIATGHTRPYTGPTRRGVPDDEFHASAIARLLTPPHALRTTGQESHG